MNWDWPTGAAFYTSSDEAGRFQFSVDSAGSYDLMVDDPLYVSNFAPLRNQHVEAVTLTAYRRDWIISQAKLVDESALRSLCEPVTADRVGHLASSIHPALVVGLGESTHGTHEFTELRSRVIAELAREGWLTTIALEAGWEETARLDEYVRLGKGTARDAVNALAYWPWRTEEFVAFIESIRKLNDERSFDKKIEFQGIDYSPPEATDGFMRRFFQGAASTQVLAGLDPLRRIINWLDLSKLSASERRELVRTFQDLTRIAESRSPASLLAAQGARISQSIVESYGQEEEFRDHVMAEAIWALLSRLDRQRHVAIWAHNQHVAQGSVEGSTPMGQHLRKRLGDKYRAIGSMFYDGSFRTYSSLAEKMVDHTVTVPPPFYLESAIYRISPRSACVFDVSEACRHPQIRDWISVPTHLRIYGGLEISESYPWPPVVVPELWSALLFVPHGTPTTSLD